MKPIILSTVILFFVLTTSAQMNGARQASTYEANNWKIWLIDNPEKIQVAAAPTASTTKKELQDLKQKTTKLDEQQLAAIKYWDAGAPAHRWNQIAPKLMSWDKPNVVLRFPGAWMNMAIYNATVLAWKEKSKNKRARPHTLDPSLPLIIKEPSTYSYPCEHTVTASAAANVLAYFYPEKGDSILQLARKASQSRIDAGVQFPSDAEAGWRLGEDVANQIIERAKKDGSDAVWDGTMNKDPKKWTGTYPLGITAPLFKPMFIQSAAQFRPPPPPDFENEMKELKDFKKNYKATSQAYYWANTGGELWNDLASQKMFEYRIADDAPTVARIYTILHTASRDAAIAVMDAKYTYWGIRPVQYDSTYKPLLTTPPFPGYPSGHALGAATSATVLSYFFPADAKQFQQLAKDCADSRFYAGIHFRSDNEVGTSMGQAIGKYVLQTWMKQ